MIKIILSILSGYALHVWVGPRTDKMTGGWPSLTKQTLGMLGVLPFFLSWMKALRGTRKDNDHLLAALLLAALGFGLGDAAGYFFEKPPE